MAKPEKPVTGFPYSADQTIRVEQVLANGTTLHHEIKGHIYRTSDGVERYDGVIPSTNPASPDPTTMVYIIDRTKHTSVLLNSKLKTATLDHQPADSTVTVNFLPLQQPQAGNRLPKLENSVTTDLGQRMQDGLNLIGKRLTGEIPAGKIGNDKPLPVTNEVWVAGELKIVVTQIEQNPITGQRTFELTNIIRTEPDPTLFQTPDGYTQKDAPPRPTPPPPAISRPTPTTPAPQDTPSFM
jgi:hypothetical protein